MDWLGINDCFSAGIYGLKYNHGAIIPMAVYGVFSQGDAYLEVCRTPSVKNTVMKRIQICSDSRAALAALAETTTESVLVKECLQVI
jgi:hypothetical protein